MENLGVIRASTKIVQGAGGGGRTGSQSEGSRGSLVSPEVGSSMSMVETVGRTGEIQKYMA